MEVSHNDVTDYQKPIGVAFSYFVSHGSRLHAHEPSAVFSFPNDQNTVTHVMRRLHSDQILRAADCAQKCLLLLFKDRDDVGLLSLNTSNQYL